MKHNKEYENKVTSLWRTLSVSPLGAADPLRVPVLGVLPLGRPTRVGVHPDLNGNVSFIFLLRLQIVFLQIIYVPANPWEIFYFFSQQMVP